MKTGDGPSGEGHNVINFVTNTSLIAETLGFRIDCFYFCNLFIAKPSGRGITLFCPALRFVAPDQSFVILDVFPVCGLFSVFVYLRPRLGSNSGLGPVLFFTPYRFGFFWVVQSPLCGTRSVLRLVSLILLALPTQAVFIRRSPGRLSRDKKRISVTLETHVVLGAVLTTINDASTLRDRANLFHGVYITIRGPDRKTRTPNIFLA